MKKDIGITDENRDYNNLNVKTLLEAISKKHKVDLSTKDLSMAKIISRKEAIMIQFHDLLPGSK